ncbi:MAG: flagellar assembly protein FliX [Rickettsiales bacterium]|nr:flagellar assembly protein FliX [Rickettsiales bacterium]|tara:strand:- start:2560 stop:3000 length:441 start_codon:yes stop_codon:yes gene_type:complete
MRILTGMIKITSTQTSAADRLKKKKTERKDSDSSGFSGLLGLSEESPSVQSTRHAAPLNNLFSMQEVSDDEHQRQQAFKQARLTLDELEKLRDGLLLGSIPVSLLHRIEDLVAKQRPLITDPALTELLNHIELRAAVELAKLEKRR